MRENIIQFDKKITLEQVIDDLNDPPWVYCGSELITSPVDDLYKNISYHDYILDLGFSNIDVDSYEECYDESDKKITRVYLNPIFEGRLITSKQIVDFAKDLIIKYNMTKQQGLIVSMVDFARISRSNTARLLNVIPQTVTLVYRNSKKKMDKE